MEIKDISLEELIKDESLKNKFRWSRNSKLNINCKILNTNFYLDSFNYFPITEDNYTFKMFYSWMDKKPEYNKFYTKKFNNIFHKRKKSFREISDAFVLGSSVSDDYFRNILFFLPRIFFINKKEINLVIHRGSSNKFRKFITEILYLRKIKIKKIIYLDHDYYKFTSSQIPNFIGVQKSIKILRHFFLKKIKKNKTKIFISRQNSHCRNLINESDFNLILKSKGFKIINITKMSIFEQIDLFSSAEVVISPTSSVLTNIIFLSPGCKVLEIIPKYKLEYEKHLKIRYSGICNHLNLKYNFIESEPVKNEKFDKILNTFIPKHILKNSNYYQDMIINKKKFEQLISNY